MTKTVLRHATSADLPVLLEIDTESFPLGISYDSEELSYFMKQDGAQTVVLENEGGIAAFIILDIDLKARAATIVTLDVRKDFRRMGFGSKLLHRSEEIIREQGLKLFGLQVDVNNSVAIAFYERHEFRVSRKLRRYYPNGNDAYLMIKTLPQDDGK